MALNTSHASEAIVLNDADSRFQQTSLVDIIQAASTYDSFVPCLRLIDSFKGIEGGALLLHCGVSLYDASSVGIIHICCRASKKFMRVSVIVELLRYLQKSTKLKEILFTGCLLPESLPPDSVPASIISMNVKVWSEWNGTDTSVGILHLQTGRWQDADGGEVSSEQYQQNEREFRERMRENRWNRGQRLRTRKEKARRAIITEEVEV